MNYFIFKIFVFFNFCSLFPSGNALYKEKIDHEAFVDFVKGPATFDQSYSTKGVENSQIKEIVSQIYGTHLGILYYIIKNWNCSKAPNVERWSKMRMAKCKEYKNNLTILYKYLFNIYAINTVVKPCYSYNRNSVHSEYIPICKIVQQYTTVFEIFFSKKETNNDDKQFEKYPFHSFFFHYRDFDYLIGCVEELWKKLLYSPIAYRSKGVEFEKIMDKMLEKVMEKAQLEERGKKENEKRAMDNLSMPAEDAVPLFDLLLSKLPQYSIYEAIEDEALLLFVKGGMKEESEFMSILIHNRHKVITTVRTINQFEMHLVPGKAQNATECNKVGHYLDIVYEYILRASSGITTVRPIFHLKKFFSSDKKCLLLIIDILNRNSIQCFDIHSYNEYYSFEKSELKLVNENELDLKQSAANVNWNYEYTFQEIIVYLAIDASTSAEKQINATSIEGLFRHAFDQKLAELLEKWTKLASEQKAKWEALMNGKDYDHRKWLYEDNLRVLLASPFFMPQ